jgi:hypothetical protein
MKKFKCPLCGALNTAVLWNEFTAKDYGVRYNSLTDITEAVVGDYKCPECERRVAISNIEVVSFEQEMVDYTVRRVKSKLGEFIKHLRTKGIIIDRTKDHSKLKAELEKKSETFVLKIVPLDTDITNTGTGIRVLIGELHFPAFKSNTKKAKLYYNIGLKDGEETTFKWRMRMRWVYNIEDLMYRIKQEYNEEASPQPTLRFSGGSYSYADLFETIFEESPRQRDEDTR